MSARARLVGLMSFSLALALAGSVAIVAAVLFNRGDARVAEELGHEATKLRAYVGTAVDPATGSAYTDVDALLTAYLRTNVPDADETFFTVIDGAAARRSPYQPPTRLDLQPEVVAWAAAERLPRDRMVDAPVGQAYVAAMPVEVPADPRAATFVIAKFTADERRHAVEATWILAVVGGLALVLATLANWFIAGRILAPIRQVRTTAQSISESDLSGRIEVTGQDDVAALAATVNAMLDRLETAFVGQREFLHDVGHELRTPLTIMRGHLELMGDDPAEQRETLGLVIDEIERMDRLVGDLSVLAQSEEPGFVRLDRVHPADLVAEVMAKARPLADRRWVIDHVADATFLGDEQRLTQALMQLISNAAAHTGPGQTIGIGSLVEGDRLRLWVRDEGTGVTREDAERIFDRRTRGAGEARRTGTGLGLSIVSSIAQAHDGHVDLTSAPGAGATFTLDLPLRPVDPSEEAPL
ncbi:HAMP domain-containing protein [Propioniciclava coleopterorum]|uniref:histidine kinase n=1 Tax=Propioniciclava coleopterorum TaxID=2714937 RepID=A0A6G7Y655_9ACTN|nr:HAMP domain-containing sensor histidine kinase [Propioniciclava coleopterorum]QIK72128.1 HAMP domain-containing protein [Propioniciclava coleopterorum]